MEKIDKSETELFTTCGNPKRVKQIKYFVDKDRPVIDEFYDLMDSFEKEKMAIKVIKAMNKLIEKDPNFFDPYLTIADIAADNNDSDMEQSYRFRAYLLAINLIADKHGNYPKEMSWGHLENRHIIRAIDSMASLLWVMGKNEISLTIYRKLLKSNLNDNIGVRNQILAIRMGLSPDYEIKFLPKKGPIFGLDAYKLTDWFDKNNRKFPEEFEEWQKANSNR